MRCFSSPNNKCSTPWISSCVPNAELLNRRPQQRSPRWACLSCLPNRLSLSSLDETTAMQTKQIPIAILLLPAGVASSIYLNTLIAPAAPAEAKALIESISADRYLNHVAYLASDDLKGRGNGTPELEKAADYIASQFRVWGLKP